MMVFASTMVPDEVDMGYCMFLDLKDIELWVKEKAHGNSREALEWIISNKNKFSEEQKNNLLKLVMSEVLK